MNMMNSLCINTAKGILQLTGEDGGDGGEGEEEEK